MQVFKNENYEVLADHEEGNYQIVNLETAICETTSSFLPEAVDIANNLQKECKRVFKTKPELGIVH